jgi:hypothetical protein
MGGKGMRDEGIREEGFFNITTMDFIAKVEEDRRSGIQEIAGALAKLGVRVKEVQPLLGMIVGSSDVLSLEQLKIAGIASVELDRSWGAGMPKRKGKGANPEGNPKDTNVAGNGKDTNVAGNGKSPKPKNGGKR